MDEERKKKKRKNQFEGNVGGSNGMELSSKLYFNDSLFFLLYELHSCRVIVNIVFWVLSPTFYSIFATIKVMGGEMRKWKLQEWGERERERESFGGEWGKKKLLMILLLWIDCSYSCSCWDIQWNPFSAINEWWW